MLFFLGGHKGGFCVCFYDVVSIDNLLRSWQEFLRGKRNKKDVQKFSMNLMDNIIELHHELAGKTYKHGQYQSFRINDPKPRQIHKSPVRDRLVHHAIHRQLHPFFDRMFIPDSFSCRVSKGTHKAINRFRSFAYKVSKNNTCTCWILKCDIRKFFENIDHEVLKEILVDHIPDKDILWLLSQVIVSFMPKKPGVGLPLGNLTSQLFVNIYMNEFDQFVKHKLKAKYYIRYSDDFIIISEDKNRLENIISPIRNFLAQNLKLELHPNKISIKTLSSGVDFLGWVNFSDHRILRTTTKRRMFNKLTKDSRPEVINSYLGLLNHGNASKLKNKIISNLSL